MKKVSVRFVILCILALFAGVSALAVGVSVSNLKTQNADVEVNTLRTDSGDPAFEITMKNAEDGKLYTVLIRSGAENDKPSGGDDGNLVYMDVVAAQNGALKVSKAYPKEMTAGTYRVFMSDYAKNAITQVATFEVGDSENLDNTLQLGDVNGKDGIDSVDALLALQISAHLIDWTDAQYKAADVNRSGGVDAVDALLILQKSAQLISSFPDNSKQS